MSRRLAETIGSAPVMVLVLAPRISMTVRDADGDMDVGSVLASVYPAVQNLVLAARSMGIGTCLTTVYRIHEAEVRAVCEIPDRYDVVALLPLGHPTGRWGVAPRRPARRSRAGTPSATSAAELSGTFFTTMAVSTSRNGSTTARSAGGPSCRPSRRG